MTKSGPQILTLAVLPQMKYFSFVLAEKKTKTQSKNLITHGEGNHLADPRDAVKAAGGY